MGKIELDDYRTGLLDKNVDITADIAWNELTVNSANCMALSSYYVSHHCFQKQKKMFQYSFCLSFYRLYGKMTYTVVSLWLILIINFDTNDLSLGDCEDRFFFN